MPSPNKTLLSATIPGNVNLIRAIYGKYFNLIVVTRMPDAVSAMDKGVDLIMCNVHFDDGALYDLLRIAKVHPLARSTPFFVVDASHTMSSPAIRHSIEIASKALGADMVIDMARWRHSMGEEAATTKVLGLVQEYVLKSDGKSAGH